MPPEDPNQSPILARAQIENRLRILLYCAIALLRYESELERQLSDINVSRLRSSISSGDNKTLSPEEIEITLAKYSRINPDDLPKL